MEKTNPPRPRNSLAIVLPTCCFIVNGIGLALALNRGDTSAVTIWAIALGINCVSAAFT